LHDSPAGQTHGTAHRIHRGDRVRDELGAHACGEVRSGWWRTWSIENGWAVLGPQLKVGLRGDHRQLHALAREVIQG